MCCRNETTKKIKKRRRELPDGLQDAHIFSGRVSHEKSCRSRRRSNIHGSLVFSEIFWNGCISVQNMGHILNENGRFRIFFRFFRKIARKNNTLVGCFRIFSVSEIFWGVKILKRGNSETRWLGIRRIYACILFPLPICWRKKRAKIDEKNSWHEPRTRG